MPIRWKDKSEITLAPDDRIPVTDVDNSNVDGYTTPSAIIAAGGGGQVNSVVAGTNISVDSTDAVNPVVSFALGTDENFVTDTEKTVIGNTSGTNTGDNAVNSLYSGLEASKQDTLVSGTNIKTINSTSLLGSGNITTPNTTYSEISEAEITTGTATDLRTITGRRAEFIAKKARTPRVSSETSSATPTINTDNVDAHSITALATAITSMTTNLSGTPTNFQKLIIRIKDNGSARAIAWGTSFEAKGVALPTTTVAGKVMTAGFIYDSVTSKWGLVALAQEE